MEHAEDCSCTPYRVGQTCEALNWPDSSEDAPAVRIIGQTGVEVVELESIGYPSDAEKKLAAIRELVGPRECEFNVEPYTCITEFVAERFRCDVCRLKAVLG